MRKCKTTSFDLSDPFEKELLEYAEQQGKFSRYIKRLIEKDKEGAFLPPTFNQQFAPEGKPDFDAMSTFL